MNLCRRVKKAQECNLSFRSLFTLSIFSPSSISPTLSLSLFLYSLTCSLLFDLLADCSSMLRTSGKISDQQVIHVLSCRSGSSHGSSRRLFHLSRPDPTGTTRDGPVLRKEIEHRRQEWYQSRDEEQRKGSEN